MEEQFYCKLSYRLLFAGFHINYFDNKTVFQKLPKYSYCTEIKCIFRRKYKQTLSYDWNQKL